MGLSAPRKRAKFSQDPNNTAWSRSPAKFGEKLLLSQGWTPGSPLGAHCAPYINPASISHIKIALKDDNLGLGAKNGALSDGGPTTGLDGLQNLLGRLNGKNEQILEKEHRSRTDSRRTIYADRRWGFGNFISGGFLVGDQNYLEDAENCENSDLALLACKVVPRTGITNQGWEREERSIRESQSEALHDSTDMAPQPRPNASVPDERVKEKIDMRSVKRSRATNDHALELPTHIQKKERKAQRRVHKAEKSAAKASNQRGRRPPDLLPPSNESQGQERAVETGSAYQSHGRHAVRKRFIQHKKMSLADQRALNEILMIKT